MATDKRERQRANRQLKNQEQAKQQRRNTTKRTALKVAGGVVGLFAVVLVLAWLGGAFDGDDETTDTIDSTLPADLTGSTTPTGDTLPNGFQLGTGECPPDGGADEPVRTFDDAPQLCIDPAAAYTATIATSAGDIVVDLDAAQQPGTVNNFVTLARYGFYDDTLLFRADPSIDIVQGGGQDNSSDPGYSIPDEGSGFAYTEGQLVMARTQAPNSAGAQWFVTAGPNAANLDVQGTYVPFGQVTSGLEIIQEMIATVSDDGQTPSETVTVDAITITQG